MDEKTEKALDAVILDELVRNERVVEHPKFGKVKIQRPTPRKEREIAEVRGRAYHKFLLDEDILSRAQLEAAAIKRGIWSEDKAERLTALSRKSGELMGLLDALGYENVDTVSERYAELYSKILGLLEEGSDAYEAADRYFNLGTEPVLQDRLLIQRAGSTTEVDDTLDHADTVRTQLDLLMELTDVRKEQSALQVENARLFMDSLEARTDRAEELARIYFCCTNAETGAPLWPTYEQIWDATPEDIEWLMQELFYFTHQISRDFQRVLENHGFTRRVPEFKKLLEDSPEHPTSNSDGESPEKTSAASSEATTPSS